MRCRKKASELGFDAELIYLGKPKDSYEPLFAARNIRVEHPSSPASCAVIFQLENFLDIPKVFDRFFPGVLESLYRYAGYYFFRKAAPAHCRSSWLGGSIGCTGGDP